MLIDHDRVEKHNLRRQNFYADDLGKFKSQALAERLSVLYGREIAYSVYPFHRDLISAVFNGDSYGHGTNAIIIGCVDNPGARKAMTDGLSVGCWWLDSGNSQNSGQVLIGNAKEKKYLKAAFNPVKNTVCLLPQPTYQLPGLLAPAPESSTPQLDCAEAVEQEDQSPVINQAMATIVLEMVHSLLKGTLTYMGAYIDLEAGSLRYVPADPETISRMCKIPVKQLVSEICPYCGRKH